MPKLELLLLPLFAIAVFYGDFWINTKSEMCERSKAIREAVLWSAGFFIYGILDRVLVLAVNPPAVS